MRKMLAVFGVGLLFSGCSATYKPPVENSNVMLSKNISADKETILKAVKKTLALNGEQIASFDAESGIVVTVPKNFKLTPEMADCGTTMGLDYLKDNRTNSKIFYNIIADNGKLTVKGVPSAEYRVGAVDQDMNLTCISRGVLEQKLLNDIHMNM